jgi:hypothetical protein
MSEHKDLLKQLVEAPYGTEDYRQAPSGNGPLASEWEDKPHRLVYDLCSKVEALIAALKPLASISLDDDGGVMVEAVLYRSDVRDARAVIEKMETTP